MFRPLHAYLSNRQPDLVSVSAVLSPLRWPTPEDASIWSSSLPELQLQGLSALALRRVPDGSEFDDIRRQLRAAAADDALRTMLMAARTAPILAELQRRAVPFVVIKGPAASRFYECETDRPYTDIDILVPGALFSRARHELEQIGLEMEVGAAGPWPSFDRWCREGINLFGDDGAAIDLHHHVPPWRWGRSLNFERLRSQADTIWIGDVEVPAASLPHQIAISTLHLLSDWWYRTVPLLALADVLNLVQVNAPHETATELRHLRIDWLVAEVLDSLPPGIVPSELRSQLRTLGPRKDRALLGLLLPPALPARHPIGFGLRLPVRNAIAFGLGSLVPSPAYIEQRFGSRRAYIAWWSQAGRWSLDAALGQDVGSPYAFDRQ